MDIYNMTQEQREADLAHTKAVEAVRHAQDERHEARLEYFKATDALHTMMEEQNISDELRSVIYKAITAARLEVAGDWAVDSATKHQRVCALRARIVSGTLTPSDFKD